MMKCTASFWVFLSLMMGSQSSGMVQTNQPLVEDRVARSYISAIFKTTEFKLAELPHCEGNTNTPGFRDPTILLVKLSDGKEKIAKFICDRVGREFIGYLNFWRFWENNIGEFENPVDSNETNGLYLFPITDYVFIREEESNTGNQVLLEIMDKADGIAISDWFGERYYNNNYSDYAEVWIRYFNIGRAVRSMHRKGFSHGDLHERNILTNDDGSKISIIDFDSMESGVNANYESDVYKLIFEKLFGAIGEISDYVISDSEGKEQVIQNANEQVIHRMEMIQSRLKGFLSGYEVNDFFVFKRIQFQCRVFSCCCDSFCTMFELYLNYHYKFELRTIEKLQEIGIGIYKGFQTFFQYEIAGGDTADPSLNANQCDSTTFLSRGIEYKRKQLLDYSE